MQTALKFNSKRAVKKWICKSESLDASKPRSLAASRCLGGNREAKSIYSGQLLADMRIIPTGHCKLGQMLS